MAQKKSEFLEFSKGRKVLMKDNREEMVRVGAIHTIPLDLRHKMLAMITDPQTAYMLFMGSLGLLYFEVTHPGTIVPGVIGGIGLVLSLISLHKIKCSDWRTLAYSFGRCFYDC